jgi:undecaprenyl-diphosphatase
MTEHREQLAQLDLAWTSRIQRLNGGKWAHRAAAILAHSGDSWLCLSFLLLVYLAGDEAWKDWSVRMGLAIVILAIIVTAVKYLVRRERPEGDWWGFYRRTDPHSFPSGHAARVFMLAFLAFVWGPPGSGFALALWAPAVSLARIHLGLHYVFDILAGGILGVLVGTILALIL